MKGADHARNFSQCDSILIGDKCGAHTFPYIDVRNPSAQMEHEATTSNIGEDQLFYCNQRGISSEDAVSMIVNGFCKEVFNELPMEFAVEATKLMEVTLEGSVGQIWNGEMLNVKKLHAGISGKEILKGVDLSIRPGEIHAVMGRNGSGKSTLSNVITGKEGYVISKGDIEYKDCLLYTSPSPRDATLSRMPSSA